MNRLVVQVDRTLVEVAAPVCQAPAAALVALGFLALAAQVCRVRVVVNVDPEVAAVTPAARAAPALEVRLVPVLAVDVVAIAGPAPVVRRVPVLVVDVVAMAAPALVVRRVPVLVADDKGPVALLAVQGAVAQA